MNHLTVELLSERIQSLETRSDALAFQSKRWKRRTLGLVGVLALGVLVGGAAVHNQIVEARAFILRGPDGNLRGSFVVGDDGGVRLTLMDQNKNAQAGMWLDTNNQATVWGFDNLSNSLGGSTNSAPQNTSVFAPPRRPASPPTTTNMNPPGYPQPQYAAAPGFAPPQYQYPPANKLVTLGSSSRVIEQQGDKWMCGYQIRVRNETDNPVDQAFYVTFIDRNGFVLTRQARMLRLNRHEETVLNGEVGLTPERAQQIAQVKLSPWEP